MASAIFKFVSEYIANFILLLALLISLIIASSTPPLNLPLFLEKYILTKSNLLLRFCSLISLVELFKSLILLLVVELLQPRNKSKRSNNKYLILKPFLIIIP